jgi:lipopolysaccharide export system protein LptA
VAFSFHKAIMAAALPLALCAAAQAEDRTRLPIKVEARSSDFDYQNNVLVFNGITIVQGDIRITAERAVASGLDFEDSSWEFSGGVSITDADAGLASDVARVRFAGGDVQSATVTGTPATFQQRRENELTQGRANRIDYDLGRGTVELAGDAWLTDGRNEVASSTLVYSTETQRIISDKPVVFTIKPGDRPKDAPAAKPPATAPGLPAETPPPTPPATPGQPE